MCMNQMKYEMDSQNARQSGPAGGHCEPLLYRSRLPQALPQADVNAVLQVVLSEVEESGLQPTEIKMLTQHDLIQRAGPAAGDAFSRLSHAMGRGPNDGMCLLACEWVPPHIDMDYAGMSFVSVVLHTGGEPYLVHASALRPATGPDAVPRLAAVARILRTGDVFVLDPAAPHMAAPLRSSEEALLVLLQLEVPDESPETRQALLARFPRQLGDQDDLERLGD